MSIWILSIVRKSVSLYFSPLASLIRRFSKTKEPIPRREKQVKKYLKKQTKRDVLRCFYDIYLNEKLVDVQDESFKEISHIHLDIGECVCEEKSDAHFDHCEIDLSYLFEEFEKVKDSKNKYGQNYEKIVLKNEVADGGYRCFYRIEGLYTETDEEYKERIERIESTQNSRKAKKEEQILFIKERKEKKKQIMEKLTPEERIVLGLK